MIEEKVMFSFLALVSGEKMMSGEARDTSGLWTKTNSDRSSSTVNHQLIGRRK